MKKNTGKGFESLTADFFEILSASERNVIVERDVYLPSPDGKRQFDIILKAEIFGFSITTAIECKDYGKKLDVTYVDGFVSKISDVDINKGIIVTKKGFTKQAYQKAKRLGIELYTLHEGLDLPKSLGFEVPLLITEFTPVALNPRGVLHLDEGTELSANDIMTINDRSLTDIILESVLNGEIDIDSQKRIEDWRPSTLGKNTFFRTSDGKQREFRDFSLNLTWHVKYYFGYLHDLPTTRTLVDRLNGSSRTLFRVDEIGTAKEKLSSFSKIEDVPPFKLSIAVKALATPTLKLDNVSMTVKKHGD